MEIISNEETMNRITFEVEEEVKKKLKIKAAEEGKTMTEVLRELLDKYLG